VAGPITFQLGADAVLGHGIALHSLAKLVAARSLAKPVRTSQMRMDIEVSRGQGTKIIEMKKDPRLTSGLSSN
jgi:hypothetical protein